MSGFLGKVYLSCFIISFAGNSLLNTEIGVAATSSSSSSSRNSFDSRSSSSSSKNKNRLIDDDLADDDYDLDEDFVKVKSSPKGRIDFTVDNTHSSVGKKSEDSHGCPVELGNRCECGMKIDRREGKDERYVVNCTDTGFTDVKILQHLPDNVEHLIFVGNEVPVLPINIFGTRNYTKLREIDMSRNGITEIKGKSFHHVNFVERLTLSFNKISATSIQNHPRVFSNFYNLKHLHLTGAFDKDVWLMNDLGLIFSESNLTKLERIHIEQNNIELIQNASIFCELPALQSIRIAQNKLTDVNISISCLKDLYYIDASYNLIRTVHPSSGLAKLLEEHYTIGKFRIELVGNPFNCDCNLDYYLKWLKKWETLNPDRVPDYNTLECKTGLPGTNADKYLKDVEIEHLGCPVLEASEYSSSATTAISWVLGVMAFLVILTVVYVNRVGVGIFRKVTPLLQSNPQGVKYTSIERNEEAEIAHV